MGLRILDLFSGIGGFSYALSPIGKTVAYCEIAPEAQAVLKRNIDRKLLDKAPIFDDVRDIGKMIDISQLKPNMITAGFPCTDISSANPHGQGLKGERSGLFSEILRILDTYEEIKVVFLENSPRIKSKGLQEIKKAMRRRGFSVRYTFLEAIEVGGYHRRKRWYCICTKGIELKTIKYDYIINKAWQRRYHKPLISKYTNIASRDYMRQRCGLLGNAVVPYCARYAWNCIIQQDTEYKMHPPIYKQKRQQLCFTDGKSSVTKDYWATPVYSTWHNYSRITDRGMKLLSNQTFYSTMSYAIHKNKPKAYAEYTTKPSFVEYLMGYPEGWTDYTKKP